MEKKMELVARIVAGVVVLAMLVLVIFRGTCVTFVDKHELGFQYDKFTGQISRLNRTGYIVRNPIRYTVHTVDLRPYQISITALPNVSSDSTSGSDVGRRVLNAKLVKFNPEGLETFIAWHGRTAGDSLNNLLEIMKCYAFDATGGRDCPFITIINEISPGQGGQSTPRNQ